MPVLLAAALAGLLAAALPARAQELDILSIYRELQVAQPNGFPAYEIAPSPDGGVRIEDGPQGASRGHPALLLDAMGAFLRVTDGGAGDDAMVTELAAWIDREGFPLVALSERGVRQGVPFGGRLRFYSRASSRWNLVTDRVWPKDLDFTLCRARGEEVTEETAGWDALGPMVALLPRAGTDIAAWCVGASPVAGTGAAIIWDRTTGTFTRGPALKGAAPWVAAGRD
ncbi:hypothetical protein [Xanthobacter sediminis]|uniref:hypothetical protein n=1 Tax=Xanthobacter sediminis TaxID=3119926 RepID=UPI00372726CF